MSLTAYLPSELLDGILQCVDREKTVITCALVCRAWVAVSRRVTFSNPIQVIQFSEGPHIPTSFATLISDPRCTFRGFINRISIYRTGDALLYEEVVNALIQYVPHLEDITLRWAPAKPNNQLSPAQRLLGNARSTVRQLNLHDFHPSDIVELLQVVSDAPNLIHVTISALARIPEHLVFPSPPPSLLSVTTNLTARSFVEKWMVQACNVHNFEVYSADGHAIHSLVEYLSKHTAVRRSILSLKPILSNSSYYEPMRAFLRSGPCAQRLGHLALDLSAYGYCESTDLDLSLTSKLQSITVHFVPTHSWNHGGVTPNARLDIILRMLSSIPTVALATLRVNLFIHSDRRPIAKQMDELGHGWASSVLELNTGFITITMCDKHSRDGYEGYPLCHTLSQAVGNFTLALPFKHRRF